MNELKKSYLSNYFVLVFIVAILASSGLFKKLFDSKKRFIQIGRWIWLMFVFSWSVILIVSTTYNPFIYFHF